MIPIRNIYYMLSYAFQVLQSQGFHSLAAEEYENTAELCAAILCKGVAGQLKQGLGRAYIPQTETLSSVRGRIELMDSIKTQSLLKKQLVCSQVTEYEFNREQASSCDWESSLLLLILLIRIL